jgi:hypothetical protein
MFKIGIVGPELSVNRILSHTDDFKDEMDFFPFPYSEVDEIEKIIRNHDFRVDAWYFSGAVPYEVAVGKVKTMKDSIYISASDSTFYKAFLELTYEKGTMIKRMSADIIGESTDFDEPLHQSKVVLDQCFTKVFQSDFKPEELFQFHFDLWNAGKTDGAITCLPTVCEQLREVGVPATWMTPTKMKIYETLKTLREKVKASYFKETQISVVIIDIGNLDKITEGLSTPYHLQYLELHIKEIIIKFCEKVKGSVIEKGHGRYMIFNTRGEIERELFSLLETIQHLSLESSNNVAAGIGYGKTVYSAEENARLAINHSKENGSRKIIICQDDNEVVEFEGQHKELKYSIRTDDQALINKLKNGNISIKVFNKLIALIQRMGWTSFTTKDIAMHMNMTERNARRIVLELYEAELVKCIGEQSKSRGRPTKIYQLC